MRGFKNLLAVLMLAAILLSACGGKAEEPAAPVSVRTALDTMEENLGEKVCVQGFPVAFFYSYTYSGKKVFSIYFSDSPEEYFGEIERVEELRDGWIEAICRENDELWQSVREIFEGKREIEEYRLLFKVEKSHTGIYYDFRKMQ